MIWLAMRSEREPDYRRLTVEARLLNSSWQMKKIGFVIIVVLGLGFGCSSREEREAKENLPVAIDKAQVDITQSDNYFQSTQRTNWHCILLAKSNPREDDSTKWERLKSMSGKTVQITDRGNVLGTGKVVGLIESQGSHIGVSISFPSPESAEEVYKKLGFRERK